MQWVFKSTLKWVTFRVLHMPSLTIPRFSCVYYSPIHLPTSCAHICWTRATVYQPCSVHASVSGTDWLELTQTKIFSQWERCSCAEPCYSFWPSMLRRDFSDKTHQSCLCLQQREEEARVPCVLRLCFRGLTRAASSCTYQSSVLPLLRSLNNHHGGYNKKSQNLPSCLYGPQQDFFLRRWEGVWTDTSGSERSDACVCHEDFGSRLRESGVC